MSAQLSDHWSLICFQHPSSEQPQTSNNIDEIFMYFWLPDRSHLHDSSWCNFVMGVGWLSHALQVLSWSNRLRDVMTLWTEPPPLSEDSSGKLEIIFYYDNFPVIIFTNLISTCHVTLSHDQDSPLICHPIPLCEDMDGGLVVVTYIYMLCISS